MVSPFLQQLVVRPEHIDNLDHVNNVVYLQWVQDVAQAHWAELSNDEVNRKFAWVVLRHEIDYHRPAKLGDVLTVRTWVGETGGFRSVRHVDIEGAGGTKLVSAKTVWCLIDAQTFRPARIGREVLDCLLPG